MTEPQIMPEGFLNKVVAEAVVVGYTRGWQAQKAGKQWPPSPADIDSIVLEVVSTMIVEFGINVHRESP